MLTREQILAAADLEVTRVEVPEWGGEVCLRPLSCREAEEWQEEILARRRDDDTLRLAGMRATLLSMMLCDEAGNPLFSREDVAALGGKSNDVLKRLFDRAQEIAGIGDDAVKDAEKN